jgi:hypothetical protein
VAAVLDSRDAAGRDLEPACRHAQPSTRGPVAGLLLPLHAVARLRKLRENVRNAEICFALVGRFLPKAARTFRGRQSRRRAEAAPSRSRRTRAAVEPSAQVPGLQWLRMRRESLTECSKVALIDDRRASIDPRGQRRGRCRAPILKVVDGVVV